jgi:hypothetical protein
MHMNKMTAAYRRKNFRFGLCLLSFALFLSLPAWLPQKAAACACCSSPGQWFEYKKRLDAYDYEVLGAPRAAKAGLVESVAEDEGAELASSEFTLKLSRQKSKWTLALQGSEGEKGSLILTLGPSATFFGSDPRDGKTSGGGGPLLYKELRLEGRVSGTGVFKGLKPDSRFRLVLQGRGAACLEKEDLSNWSLQLYGKQTRLAFYGSFEK